MPKIRQPAAEKVLQSSGSGNYQSRAGTQSLDLRLLGYAADYQRRFRRSLAAELLVLLMDLHRKFACRQQNQSAGLAQSLA